MCDSSEVTNTMRLTRHYNPRTNKPSHTAPSMALEESGASEEKMVARRSEEMCGGGRGRVWGAAGW